MQQTSRHFARLFKAQTLVKEREEAQLQTERQELDALEKESHYLFGMMQKGSNADFIDPQLLARRLERGRRTQNVLKAKIDERLKTLLQATRRCDILQKKQREALSQEERRELADMLEEFVARQSL